MTFGVTETGFQSKRIEDIKAEMEASLRGELGQGINLDAKSPLGQIVGVLSEREALLWDEMENTYNSAFPDTSEGVNLDKVLSITGNTRKSSTFSTVTGKGFGTLSTIVPAGTIVSNVNNSEARFVTDVAFVIDQAAVDEIQKIAFDADPDSGSFKITFPEGTTTSLAFNASAATIQTACEAILGVGNIVVAGSITLATGLTLTYQSGEGAKDRTEITITDNLLLDVATPVVATPSTDTEGSPAYGTVSMTAEDEGEIQAPSGSLTVIETPVGGLDSFTNELDAELGREVETDPEARVRREEVLQIAGAATPEAIRSELLALTDVTAVIVFQNRTSVTVIDGAITRPPHSIDIVVQGGDEDEIAEEIWSVVGAGITMIGDITKVVTDSRGKPQEVRFSRPTGVDIYITYDLTTDTEFPADGADQVKANAVAIGNAYEVGDDVIVIPDLVRAVGGAEELEIDPVPGVTDMVIKVGKTASPTLSDNIIIDDRELSEFDTSRTIVNIL